MQKYFHILCLASPQSMNFPFACTWERELLQQMITYLILHKGKHGLYNIFCYYAIIQFQHVLC